MELSLVSYATRSLAKALIYELPDECKRCPACDSRRLFDLDMIRFRRSQNVGFVSGCRGCGLVFTNPLRSEADLAQFYSPSGEWGQTRTGAAARPAPKLRPPGRGKWFRQFDAIRDDLRVEAPPPGARVFDYGCGPGKDLDVLQDCGWDTWGLETAVDEAFTRHRRLHAVPDEPTFDLVIVNHVLEHVTNPLGLLRQLAGACRVGGYLLVGVPRFDTLPIHRDYRYVINGRTHVTAYTLECLVGLLARAGFGAVDSSVASDATGLRLRMLAKRADGILPLPAAPARMARQAVRTYYEDVDERPALTRLGLFRLAARCGVVPK
jgi:SAM-dependent methyltransferase